MPPLAACIPLCPGLGFGRPCAADQTCSPFRARHPATCWRRQNGGRLRTLRWLAPRRQFRKPRLLPPGAARARKAGRDCTGDPRRDGAFLPPLQVCGLAKTAQTHAPFYLAEKPQDLCLGDVLNPNPWQQRIQRCPTRPSSTFSNISKLISFFNSTDKNHFGLECRSNGLTAKPGLPQQQSCRDPNCDGQHGRTKPPGINRRAFNGHESRPANESAEIFSESF